MTENTLHPYNNIVKGRIARKANGQALTLRILFSPDDVDIPDGDEVCYQVKQEQFGTITLTPEEGAGIGDHMSESQGYGHSLQTMKESETS